MGPQITHRKIAGVGVSKRQRPKGCKLRLLRSNKMKTGDKSGKGNGCCKQQRRKWHPTPVLLPGKSRGRRILAGCCLWGCTELDTTERLHFHFSLSCTGEGDGTHSSTLAWKIPWTEEPGALPSMGSHRVRHNWSDLAAAAAAPQHSKTNICQ